MVNVAVVGAGSWGRNHVRTWASLPGAKLVAVCDGDPATLERAGRVAGGAALISDYGALLRRDDVRAVVLATPVVHHAAHARAALEAGKDVLVEKPLATTVREAQQLCEIASARGSVLMAGHILRYHPGVEKLLEIVRSGEIGEIYYAHAVRVNLGRLRRDENALFSLGPHDISVLLAVFDAEPDSVSAAGAAYLQPGVEDVVFLNMSFPDRRLAQLHISWLDPRKDRRLTVVGSKKMVVFDDTDPSEMIRVYDKGFDRPPEFSTFGEFLSIRTGDIRIPHVEMREPLAAECAHFVSCIEQRREPLTSGQEALRVVRVLEAAQTSLAQHGTPVYW